MLPKVKAAQLMEFAINKYLNNHKIYIPMANKEFQFKTNLNCGGCIASVKPHLDNAEGVYEWNVDTTNKDKILTVKSDGITEEQVLEIIKNTGFKAEPLPTQS